MISNPLKKIIIVDDEPNIVLALRYLMEEQGYDVYACYDGVTAVEMVTSVIPDLVILDVMMPGMDGFSVAKYIRNQEVLDKTAIIFLTAKGTAHDKMEGYDSGAESYIIKPFDNDEITDKVQEVLSLTIKS
ncbi:MAG: response regulator [Saprospiraceae bacterium]|nr:response regulator [Saprospiraceae bacterium]MBK8669736.1 response regulator [Saprospiraceae bacterium]